MKPILKKYLTLDVFLVFGVTFGFLLAQFGLRIPTDWVIHAHFVERVVSGEMIFPGNFLYYALLWLCSFGAKNFVLLMGASAFLGAFFVGLKYIFTQKIVRILGGGISERRTVLFSMAMMVIFALPSYEFLTTGTHFYTPQVPPNAWHNSTFVAMMPFSVALFWVSYLQILEGNSMRRLSWILALVLVNIAIKPSFFLVFVLIFPIFLVQKFRFSKAFWLNLIPILIGLIQLSIENYFIFHHPRSFYYFPSVEATAAVVIRPFYVWSMWSQQIWFSWLGSSFFPILAFIFYGKTLLKIKIIQYSTLLYVSSMAIYILLTENNPHDYAGNFSNQAQAANYIWFLTIGVWHFSHAPTRADWRHGVLRFTFWAHVFSGILYLIYFLFSRTYR